MAVLQEHIAKHIFRIRGERVMLDMHLASLFGVENRALKQAVRRNMLRFPEDFMFILSEEEVNQVVSQNVIPSKRHLGGSNPYAFTESGVAMLASVLKSQSAIEMNLTIVRTFVALRRLAENYTELLRKLESMEELYDGKFKEIYDALNYLIHPPNPPRKEIGYKLVPEK